MRTLDRRACIMVILAAIARCAIFPPAAGCQVAYCFSGSDWTGDGRGNFAIWRPSNGL